MHHAHTTEHATGRRGTLARVTRQLEDAIDEANLRNELRLPPERELAHSLGVSRATVREAIQRLIATGRIDVRPGSGLFIRNESLALERSGLALFAESAATRSDTLECRTVVECAAAQFAAMRISESELEDLRAILERMSDAVCEVDLEAEALADTQFHLALVKASHNRMLCTLYQSVAPALRSHITKNTLHASAFDTTPRRLASARLAHHRAIYDAVFRHRPHEAYEAMKVHIEFVGQQFDMHAQRM